MYIIFGDQHVEQLKESYILLPLDRVRVKEDIAPVQSWCVITQEEIGDDDAGHVSEIALLHEKLMYSYGRKDWDFCERALQELHGKFQGTLDSFYEELSQRIDKYKQQDPGQEWDGIYDKVSSSS